MKHIARIILVSSFARLYGAMRGVSVAFLVALVCLATRLVFRYSYLLLWVLLAGALLGALDPGRVVRERSAWRTIREAVGDMCSLVNGKNDPYEKALLTLLLIAYIQPFTDGNKRTSRLMANSLLISRSLCPLSFRTVEANDYRAALLLFYEQNNLSAFKKMFLEQVEFAMKEYF